jgi:CubicO group peptidase (beta-lactamase class C family)
VLCSLIARSEAAGPGTLENDPELRKAVEAQGRQFVEAINSGDVALRTRTMRAIFAPPALENDGERKLLGLLDRLGTHLGTLEFHHAEAIAHGDDRSRRFSLHAYARSGKDGRWRDLQFFLEPTPPHRITSFVFLADVAEPVYLPNGEVTSAATLEWLGGYVDKLVADEDLAGGLLIAQGDRVIFERCFGFADSARTRRVTAGTRFNLGSGGKMFTALVLARLVEEGRVSFGDRLDRHLPTLAKRRFAPGVTLAHVLTHTSGIGEYWTAEYERQWHAVRTLDDALPFVFEAGTVSAPGERFGYSNSNYLLAGLVVEAVTGKAYDDVLDERLFRPLGMRSTGLLPFDDADTTQAQRLTRGATGWQTASHGYRGSSAGGALSTGADMLRFARGLVEGRIVSPAMLADMTTSKTAGLPDDPTAYGYGFILERTRDGRASFGHGGIAQGVNFELRHFPDSDITLIAWCNQDNGAYDDLRRNAVRLITGER